MWNCKCKETLICQRVTDRTWTGDIWDHNPTLYQLSYNHHKRGWPDLNRQPPDRQSDTLTNWATAPRVEKPSCKKGKGFWNPNPPHNTKGSPFYSAATHFEIDIERICPLSSWTVIPRPPAPVKLLSLMPFTVRRTFRFPPEGYRKETLRSLRLLYKSFNIVNKPFDLGKT